jgi:Caspase domain
MDTFMNVVREITRFATSLTLIFIPLVVSSRAFAFQEPAPGVIHALLVADSDSSLGDSVKHDVSQLTRALTLAFQEHPSRLRLHSPLLGSAVTVSAIESFFNDLRSGPEDTLFFYFSGHGEVRPELGHVLNFANPDEKERKILPRFELLALLKAKNPRLTVVLTDCCSAIRRPPVVAAAEARVEVHPPPAWAVAGCLLLQHRGVVDITASCPGQAAWPNQVDGGGILTGAFAGLLDRYNVYSLDKNKDGFVEWNEFYPVLEKRTQSGFSFLQFLLWQMRQRAIRQKQDPDDVLSEDQKQASEQPTQKTWTCSILPFLRVGVRVVDSGNGLTLEEIYPGTPASTASGLKQGDTIVGVGDTPVRNEKEFLLAVDANPGDKPLMLKVREAGASLARTVTIALRDNELPPGVRRWPVTTAAGPDGPSAGSPRPRSP